MRRGRLWALAVLMLLVCGVPAGCSGGVVGGECRAGFNACEGRCIDPLSDGENCGRCGNACGDGVACVGGVCGSNDASSEGGLTGSGGASGGASGASGGASGASSGGAGNADAGTLRDASTDGALPPDGTTDGGRIDGSAGGAAGATSDAGGASSGGTTGDGAIPSTGGVAGSSGSAGTGGTPVDSGVVCTPPYDTSARCGACDQSCPQDAPLCSLGADGYFCTTLCTPPLIACGSQCVNTDSDENNCGQCGRRCASEICQGGQCVGATAGHEVVFCMDFRTAAALGSAPEQLLANALFLGSKATVRVLGYTENAAPAVTATVDATLTAAAQDRGRSYTMTRATTSLDVANELSVTKFDVLLVYDQPAAPAGRLAAAGTSIADAVDAFVRAGGVVVVLAGDTGRGEMASFVSAAGLFPVTGQALVTNSLLYDRGPADAIGVNVVSPFRAPSVTCRFMTAATPDDTTVFVVTDSPSSSGVIGAPVVVHRVVAP